ncbi:MAG: hypothetical protein JXA52_04560, partial [Planctomycetes bacterium]|nr:hypothetical protein [Planctomycetota bacterium]
PLPKIESKHFHSLRALVLILCIVFGLALGFLYNISKEPTPETEPDKPLVEIEPAETAGTEESGQEDLPTIKPLVKVMTPDSTDKDDTASLIDETKGQLRDGSGLEIFLDINSGEYPTLLPKKPYGGLTGANAPPPDFGLKQPASQSQLAPGLPLGEDNLAPDLDMDF